MQSDRRTSVGNTSLVMRICKETHRLLFRFRFRFGLSGPQWWTNTVGLGPDKPEICGILRDSNAGTPQSLSLSDSVLEAQEMVTWPWPWPWPWP